MEEIKERLIQALLETLTYDELTEKQEKLVVEYETEKLKPIVDQLRENMTGECVKETIHEWWENYEIADGTEENLLAYV